MIGNTNICVLFPNPSAFPAPLKCIGIISGKSK